MNTVMIETTGPAQSARTNKRRRSGRGKARKATQITTRVVSPPEPAFDASNFYRLSELEKKEKVQEYFAWAGERDENLPFDLDIAGIDEYCTDCFRFTYGVWAAKRNFVHVLEDELKKLAVKIENIRVSSGNIGFAVWHPLKDLFDAQHKNYLVMVAETNSYRKANLVWDSMGIVPYNFKTLMV